MSIYLPLLPTDLCGCAAVVGWRNARSDLCIFLFVVQKVLCWMQKGCAEGIMFFTPRQKLARIRHKLSLQLWLERGKIARNTTDVARTRAVCPQQRGLVGDQQKNSVGISRQGSLAHTTTWNRMHCNKLCVATTY